MLTWCSHIASAARDVQAQRAKQLESLLAPARNVLSFWEGLYAISSPSSWILRRLLVAAIEGVPTLQLCGCETVASGYLDSSGAHVGSPDISTLVKTQVLPWELPSCADSSENCARADMLSLAFPGQCHIHNVISIWH